MKQFIARISLVVHDYDEAIAFYTQKVGFRLIEDTLLDNAKRWVVVAPPGAKECTLLLAKATTDEQKACVGFQTGGRVFLFLYTDDIHRDHARLKSNGVIFVRELSEEPYGTVAVFKDLYGNLWDLIQPAS